jgi:hypothetical protein
VSWNTKGLEVINELQTNVTVPNTPADYKQVIITAANSFIEETIRISTVVGQVINDSKFKGSNPAVTGAWGKLGKKAKKVFDPGC